MKHVKEFITERKKIAPYQKYRDFLSEKYNTKDVEMYEEDGRIHLFISKDFDPKTKEDIFDLLKEMDSLGHYTLNKRIWVTSGNVGLTFIKNDVSPEFMENLRMEMEVKKFNL